MSLPTAQQRVTGSRSILPATGAPPSKANPLSLLEKAQPQTFVNNVRALRQATTNEIASRRKVTAEWCARQLSSQGADAITELVGNMALDGAQTEMVDDDRWSRLVEAMAVNGIPSQYSPRGLDITRILRLAVCGASNN